MKINIINTSLSIPMCDITHGSVFMLNNDIFMRTNDAVLDKDATFHLSPAFIPYVNVLNLSTGDLDYIENDVQVYPLKCELNVECYNNDPLAQLKNHLKGTEGKNE